MKVGFHGWHPHLAGHYSTADPNGFWLLPLFKYLKSYKIEPVWLGNTHECLVAPTQTTMSGLDAVFFSWRWDLGDNPKYDDRNEAYRHQMRLLRECERLEIPAYIHDQDYKISDEDMQLLISMPMVFLRAPAMRPKKFFQTLHFPFLFKLFKDGDVSEKKNAICYVGNEYERYEIVKRYVGGLHKPPFPEIFIAGNWLDCSVPREQVFEDFPSARFVGKVPQDRAVEYISQFKLNLMFGKPEYMKTGLLAIRWMEAVIARTPSLIPFEYRLDMPGRIRDRADIARIFWILKSEPDFYKLMLEKQTQFVLEQCDPAAWTNMFRSLT